MFAVINTETKTIVGKMLDTAKEAGAVAKKTALLNAGVAYQVVAIRALREFVAEAVVKEISE